MSDALAGFTKFEFDDGRWTRPVYRIGLGPAVIVIHEIPGLHPQVLAFARDVAAEGMTVFCPSLFGEPGKPVSNLYLNATMLKLACVGREFAIWSGGRSSPFVDWLRALARKAHAECGGKGVGAVGMCFTGGFALAMMVDDATVAPVVCQPSTPFVGTAARAADLNLSPADAEAVRRRALAGANSRDQMSHLLRQLRASGSNAAFLHKIKTCCQHDPGRHSIAKSCPFGF